MAAIVEAARCKRFVKNTRISDFSSFQYSVRRNSTGSSPAFASAGNETIWSFNTLPFAGISHSSSTV